MGRISRTKRGGRAQREYGKEEKDKRRKKKIRIVNTVHLLYIRNTDTGTIKRMGRACFSSYTRNQRRAYRELVIL
jgi:hypothetical protein